MALASGNKSLDITNWTENIKNDQAGHSLIMVKQTRDKDSLQPQQ